MQHDRNASIVVYLTQQFVNEGLTFKEYAEYDRSYSLDGNEIYKVNDSNIYEMRWVKTNMNAMVITLQLDDIESNHLRVLDHFLDVYGFNITYEITSGPVRSDSCTMMDCGFTGYCYDYYTYVYLAV